MNSTNPILTSNPNAPDEIVKLYCTSQETEAYLICQRLIDESIDARVVGQHADDGHRATAANSNVEIWIPRKQLKPAARYLIDWGFDRKPSRAARPFTVVQIAMFLALIIGVVSLVMAMANYQA